MSPPFFQRDRVLIIAEVGNNHEGDFALARDLVGLAAEAGADAVKFQTFLPDHYVSSVDAERLQRLREFQLSFDQFAKLADDAHAAGILFISTPFDLESARFLGSIVDAIKVASGDNTHYPLLEEVAHTGKPAIVSTGVANRDEIDLAAHTIWRAWDALGIDPGLALLHCVASYPVPTDEANLSAIASLRSAFPAAFVGYSDHTIGINAPRLAVAAGARIVEKHFTIANDHSDFRDHQLSADPRTMTELVVAIRETEALLGDGVLGMAPCEESSATAIRRSIATTRDLQGGHVLTPDDLTWVRPGSGIAPGNEDQVVGKTLVGMLKAGEVISSENLE